MGQLLSQAGQPMGERLGHPGWPLRRRFPLGEEGSQTNRQPHCSEVELCIGGER